MGESASASPREGTPVTETQGGKGRRHWGEYPDDPKWWTEPAGIYGTVVVIAMMAIFAFFGLTGWMGHHHDELVVSYAGQWVGRAGSSSPPQVDRLLIEEEYAHGSASPYATEEPTGNLVIRGVLNDEPVDATVDIDDFPPWVYEVHFRQGDREWTLTVAGDSLTATAGDGVQRRLIWQR